MSNHHIVHVELAATNIEVGGKFYADLFGWQVETPPLPLDSGYKFFQTGEGQPTGGFPEVNNESVKAGDTLVYVSTDDVEATLAKAEALGGKILAPKFEVPTVGWVGIIGDPAGNKVAAIQLMPSNG